MLQRRSNKGGGHTMAQLEQQPYCAFISQKLIALVSLYVAVFLVSKRQSSVKFGFCSTSTRQQHNK